MAMVDEVQDRWLAEFPVKGNLVHFNHAGVCPLPARTAAAVNALAEDQRDHGPANYAAWVRVAERGRARLAALLGARTDEVCYVKNTTSGLIIAAESIPWRDGDNVLVADVEFPANVYPWLNLARRGVQTRFVPARERPPGVDDFAAAADEHTRVLAVSWVQFATGQRADLAALAELAHELGAYLVVDAIQGLGALEIDVEELGVDFLAADGHKWLLSVEGCGVFYASRRVMERLEPFWLGWMSVERAGEYLDYDREPLPGARRFEEGSLNALGFYALDASVGLILEVGRAQIERLIMDLGDRLIEGLRRLGCEITSPLGPGERSGILCFRHERRTSAEIVVGLGERGIVTADRFESVRVSPHFYNDEGQVECFLEALSEILTT